MNEAGVQIVPDIGLGEITVRLLVAAALSGAVGLEREIRERVAGLRTHMLVGVGAALFTLVSAYAWADFVFDRDQGTVYDPTRIAAQIVTGIGFLGAGVIFRQGASVRGLTTAAGLWVVAAIGVSCGAGYYEAAAITTGIVLVAFGPVRWVEYAVNRVGGDSGTLEIELDAGHPVGDVVSFLRGRRARINGVELEDEEDRRILRVDIDLPIARGSREVAEALTERDDVRAVRWVE
ncbi:MAG TPA: MgtC/SapB family protein [Gaiellaceae bacterium]|nr:MgtC/SapB family protein [Gaiellaceae bacterium]